MTALKQYKVLETTGLWRASPDAQRRDVVVSFGDTSLVISQKTDVPLTHWSLAALVRMNPRQTPAIYSPDTDGVETLEIDDDLMIEALEKVIASVARRAPHPGRLRRYIFGSILVVILFLMVFWLPGALHRHTLTVVPEVTRAQIGADLLTEIQRLTGSPCRAASGARALNRLRMRLMPEMRAIKVLPSGLQGTAHLPGGYILIGNALLTAQDDPEAIAGFLLAEKARMQAQDALSALLYHAGTLDTFRLLTSGEMPGGALNSYAELLLTEEQAPFSTASLSNVFAEAQISTSAFARTQDQATAAALTENNPYPAGSPRTVMGDGDWIILQQICG